MSGALGSWPAPVAARLDALARPGAMAAFDADETLWDGDAGVGFLRWCAERGELPDRPGRPGREAFDRYRELRPRDEGAALALCATSYAGLSPGAVAGLCQDFFRDSGLEGRVFPAMRELVGLLLERQVDVYVVTASPAFAVVPGARLLGIPAENVVGIRLGIEEGRYLDAVVGDITYRGFKASGLRGRAGRSPVMAFGNGSNDVELLASAEELAVAVNPSTTRRQDGAPSLAEEAERRGWPVVHLAL